MSARSRRGFLAGFGAAAVACGVPTVTAQSTVEVTGQVRSASGAPVSNSSVVFVPEDESELIPTTTDSDGRFSRSVPTDTEFHLNFIQSPGPPPFPDIEDEIPLQQYLDSVRATERTELGTFDLPPANRVNARVVDRNGQPVQDATIKLISGGYHFSQSFTTDPSGYVKHVEASERVGVDLAGEVEFRAWPPGSPQDGDPAASTSLVVDSDTNLTLTLPETDVTTDSASSTGGAATDGSGSGGDDPGSAGDGDEEPNRGFFSNSGDEPEFLSDAVNLTTLGFGLSAIGLVYQLAQE
ncbi:carboxypeptidase-like regulatory domain-containing protein [Halobaculum sp. CBA1158]|uniref:carboxypeptidase-like regulatory domain-containing protein n=1 Tax=Halobaculum sp. CBA1158 TaxID=2904243 RepID=UPI001F1CAC73|nr:carboxypeptidase-like regulatory domain-containing protein [Halobaculum sp. CBA1158]UIO99795.1 carboxypeptidase-like regulatory domain-containing protein [Halobaculum sp. CBA1158]